MPGNRDAHGFVPLTLFDVEPALRATVPAKPDRYGTPDMFARMATTHDRARAADVSTWDDLADLYGKVSHDDDGRAASAR